jgi:hypothetical protein
VKHKDKELDQRRNPTSKVKAEVKAEVKAVAKDVVDTEVAMVDVVVVDVNRMKLVLSTTRMKIQAFVSMILSQLDIVQNLVLHQRTFSSGIATHLQCQ